MVLEIKSMDEFEKCLNHEDYKDKLIVMDFYAEWCGPCKMIAPTFKKLSEEFTDVIFLKVNVDEVAEVAELNEISALPTFMFLKNGTKVDRLRGADMNGLKQKIENLRK